MIRALSTIILFSCWLSCFGASPAGSPTVSVDTIADLVARNPVPNERVLLSGFRSAGDFGPQRIVRHDPSSVAATNLGCVYANAGSGRYLADDCESGEVDVRWFGAYGNGTNEDSAALQSAVGTGHRTVKIPYGTFLISTQVVLPTHTKLVGPGTLLCNVPDSATGGMLYSSNVTDITLESLRIVATNHLSQYAYRADLTSNIRVVGNIITNIGLIFTRGYTNPPLPDYITNLVAISESYDISKQSKILVSDNICIGANAKSNPYGDPTNRNTHCVVLNYVQDAVVRGNFISGYFGSIWGLSGVALWSEDDGMTYVEYVPGRTYTRLPLRGYRITESHNTIKDCQWGPYYIGGKEVSIVNNVVSDCTDVGCVVDVCEGVTIAGNSIRNCDAGYIWVGQFSHDVSVTGNTVVRDEKYADPIWAAAFPRAWLMNWDGTGYNTNAVVSGNTFVDRSGSTNAIISLGKSSSGIKNLIYANNHHENVWVDAVNPAIQNATFIGNQFVRSVGMPGNRGCFTLGFAFDQGLIIKNNTFKWEPKYVDVLAVTTDAIRLRTNAWYAPKTGAKMRYYKYNATISNLTDGSEYYLRSVGTNWYTVYDTYANATNTVSTTGLIGATNLVYGSAATAPRFVEAIDPGYAVTMLRANIGTDASLTDLQIDGNYVDWPNAYLFKAIEGIYPDNATNYLGNYFRLVSPIRATITDERYGPYFLSGATVKTEELGKASRFYFGKSLKWDGSAFPNAAPTNVIVAKGSGVFDATPYSTASWGMVAGADGLWVNSLGNTSWTNGTYILGDCLISTNTLYVCVVAGPSTVAPGSPDSNGYVFEGTTAWWSMGSIAEVPKVPIGQAGYRTWPIRVWGNLTPQWVGEEVFDTLNKVWWKSRNLTTSGWSQLLSPPGTDGLWGLYQTNSVGYWATIVPIAPTDNGAYVLFVTNGVASWIAHP